MKQMIDIPNSLYANLQKIQNGSIACKRILETVKNGTPLSELEDCISRQAAIDACLNGWNKDFKEIMEDIKKLPPVKPEQKMGRWVVTDDDLVYCSECGDSYYSRPIDASWYYCPNCGARMEGEE